MDNIPEGIQNTIDKYKHQLEFCAVIEELRDDVWFYCGWCGKAHRLFRGCHYEGGAFSEYEYDDSDIDSDDFGCIVCEHQISIEPNSTT